MLVPKGRKPGPGSVGNPSPSLREATHMAMPIQKRHN